MIGLVDGNDFYVSCERVFIPSICCLLVGAALSKGRFRKTKQ